MNYINKMKKRIISLCLGVVLLAPTTTVFAVEEPTVSAETAVLLDAKSGKVLYDKNADQKMYPASITKLMTILLAVENGTLSDEVTMSHEAVFSIEPGSAHIALQEDEILTLEQLLRAIILRSANEASNGVAEYVDGSLEAFAKHMTERAKELGCKTTNFVNANGLHDENHYTTAYDMALIAQQLLQNESYRSLMSDTYFEIAPTNKQTETRYLHGQHQMLNPKSLYYYESAIGGKTGFTSQAKNTLVTYAKQGETELIAVVLHCEGAEHYVDTAALFDYGFGNFETVQAFAAADHAKTISVTDTYKKKSTELAQITVAPEKDVYLTVPKGTDISSLKITAECADAVEAPVTEGQQIGTLAISLGGEAVDSIPLLADTAVAARTAAQQQAAEKDATTDFVKKAALVCGGVIALFAIVFCITRSIGYYQYKKRRGGMPGRTKKSGKAAQQRAAQRPSSPAKLTLVKGGASAQANKTETGSQKEIKKESKKETTPTFQTVFPKRVTPREETMLPKRTRPRTSAAKAKKTPYTPRRFR